MGSSNKKKKEKAQDFKKPKLKVGKTKPKPSNFTSTSFKAKSIVLATQSIHSTAPTTSYLFTHHLSLLKHHSPQTRRESLSYLTTHLAHALSSSSLGPSSEIPTTATLIPMLSPVILDPSQSTRAQLLILLKTLPRDQVAMYIPKLMLYVNSAMTHISDDIRGDSTKFLRWVLDISAGDVMSGGGWGKGLWGLVGVLGWGGKGGGGGVGTEQKVVVTTGKAKTVIMHLEALKEFLVAGLLEEEKEEEEEMMMMGLDSGMGAEERVVLPHWTTNSHMLPTKSNGYAYLNLFATPATSNKGVSGQGGVDSGVGGEPEDLDSRRRYVLDGPGKAALGTLKLGLEGLKKEGGEMGRVAGKVLVTLEMGLGEKDVP